MCIVIYGSWILANSNCSSFSGLLFGRGKISSLMGDVAKGIKSFKKGLSDETPNDNVDKTDDQENSNKN